MSDSPFGPWPPPLPPRKEPPTPPLSVWLTGQRDLATQLCDSGYVPGTETDPHLMPPAVAAHAITTYTHPGELVLDPNCGTGTVLVEALRAGRHTLGLTAQQRWWKVARSNITTTKTAGAWRDGSVLDARPKMLAGIRAAGLVGRVGLILTTLRTSLDDLTRSSDRDPDTELETALADLAVTMSHCEPLLRSGGYVVVAARPRRRSDGALVDLPTRLIDAAASAGLVPIERCVALTAAVHGSRVITRASFAERKVVVRTQGAPVTLTAHHDVLAFQLPHDAELAAAAAPRPCHIIAVRHQRTDRNNHSIAHSPVGRRAA